MTIPQTEPGEIETETEPVETETEIVQNIEVEAEEPVQETKANEPLQDITAKVPAKEDSLQLRVAEAYHKDAGKGVARIGVGALTSLGLENGGVVEIKGKDKVYAIAWPGTPDDPQDLIRIDGNTRANLVVGIDTRVQVSRAQARPARKIRPNVPKLVTVAMEAPVAAAGSLRWRASSTSSL